MSNIKRRAVVFNLDDPFQKKLYEYTLQFSNFSAFGKGIIQREMDGEMFKGIKQPVEEVHNEVEISNEIFNDFI